MKSTKSISEGSRYLSLDLNPEPPEYNPNVLNTWPQLPLN
jgi:hypothetical protein